MSKGSRKYTIDRTGRQLEIIEADSSYEPASIEEIEESYCASVVDKIYRDPNAEVYITEKVVAKKNNKKLCSTWDCKNIIFAFNH